MIGLVWLFSHLLKKEKNPTNRKHLLHITTFFINKATYILHEAFSWQAEETTSNQRSMCWTKIICSSWIHFKAAFHFCSTFHHGAQNSIRAFTAFIKTSAMMVKDNTSRKLPLTLERPISEYQIWNLLDLLFHEFQVLSKTKLIKITGNQHLWKTNKYLVP